MVFSVFSRLRLLSWTLAFARLAVRFGVDRVRGARAFEERLCARVRAYSPINKMVGTAEVGTDARRPCPVP